MTKNENRFLNVVCLYCVPVDDSLTVYSADAEHDSGEYKCEARNTAGVAAATYTINVHEANDTVQPCNSQTTYIKQTQSVLVNKFLPVKNCYLIHVHMYTIC